ncbi:MAG TPA: SPOR domain-containing protein [Novimethylophilus sp.]|jgi:DedD protein|uniref:SPOR domain-containing protein n=1 Tax=Novimethylophilus sp. TaxID=2137426 RepID=UPI002F4298E0
MAAEQLTDKENQFKKRARRRLVGAVALVLLMVTILPMVLDDRGGQKTPQPEIAISIPSQDGAGFSSKIVPVTPEPPAPAKPAVQMTSPLEKPGEAKAPTVTTAEPKNPVAVSNKAKPVAVVNLGEPVSAEDKPTSVQPKGLPETAKKTDAPKPAQPAAAESKKGTVSVQVGVFSDAAKVKQIRTRIAESGVQCYTENLQTPKGVKIRLRCGPFPGKTEAQQALEHIKAAGFGGILVTNQ